MTDQTAWAWPCRCVVHPLPVTGTPARLSRSTGIWPQTLKPWRSGPQNTYSSKRTSYLCLFCFIPVWKSQSLNLWETLPCFLFHLDSHRPFWVTTFMETLNSTSLYCDCLLCLIKRLLVVNSSIRTDQDRSPLLCNSRQKSMKALAPATNINLHRAFARWTIEGCQLKLTWRFLVESYMLNCIIRRSGPASRPVTFPLHSTAPLRHSATLRVHVSPWQPFINRAGLQNASTCICVIIQSALLL